MEGLINEAKEFRLYSDCNENSAKDFEWKS